jgi:glycosyltransferase involved in cell wall biosynthesis
VSGTPEVTVVIPTRDRRRLLSANALPCALGQEEVALEVIVVDDGSRDGTASHVRALGDARVRVIGHDVARGPSAARNAGIDGARGEWVALLDDDDLWSPRKLRSQLDAAAAAAADWVYARSVVVDEDGAIIAAPEIADPDTIATSLLQGNVLWGGDSNVMARTSLFRQLGGFDERLECFEDWDLWIRLARAGTASACPEVLVATLDHRERLLFRLLPDVMGQLETMLAKHRAVTRSDRLGAVEWLAGEHARAGRRFEAARLYLRAALVHRSPGNLLPAIGALFGAPGLAAAARAHLALRGRTHLTPPATIHAMEIPWLATRRSTTA